LREHDLVALRADQRALGLPKGQTGTIVFVYSDRNQFEVEFDLPGRKPLVETLAGDRLEKVWDARSRSYLSPQHLPGTSGQP